jgi:uncharacterized coiled-coil protein SlyX
MTKQITETPIAVISSKAHCALELAKFRASVTKCLTDMGCRIQHSTAEPHEFFICSNTCTFERVKRACEKRKDWSTEFSIEPEVEYQAPDEDSTKRIVVLSEADEARAQEIYSKICITLIEAERIKGDYQAGVSLCEEAMKENTRLNTLNTTLEARIAGITARLKQLEEQKSPKAHEEALRAKEKQIAELESELNACYIAEEKRSTDANPRLVKLYEQKLAEKEKTITALEAQLAEHDSDRKALAEQLETARTQTGINTASFDSILKLALRYIQDFTPNTARIALLFSSLRKGEEIKKAFEQPDLAYLIEREGKEAVETAKSLKPLSAEELKATLERYYDEKHGAEYLAKKSRVLSLKEASEASITALEAQCRSQSEQAIIRTLEDAIRKIGEVTQAEITMIENAVKAYETERNSAVEHTISVLKDSFKHLDSIKTKEEEIGAIKTKKIPLAIHLDEDPQGMEYTIRVILPIAENLAEGLHPGVRTLEPDAEAIREFTNEIAQKMLFGGECLRTLMQSAPAEMKILRDSEKGIALASYELKISNGNAKSALYAVTLVNEMAFSLKHSFKKTEYGKKGFTLEVLPIIESSLESKISQEPAEEQAEQSAGQQYETPEEPVRSRDTTIEYVLNKIRSAGAGGIKAPELARQLTEEKEISRNQRAVIFVNIKKTGRVAVSGRCHNTVYTYVPEDEPAKPTKSEQLYQIIHEATRENGFITGGELAKKAAEAGLIAHASHRANLKKIYDALIDSGRVVRDGQSRATRYHTQNE